MKFVIKSELDNRIRIRVAEGRLDYIYDQRLSYAVRQIKGVKDVKVYRRTGGAAITFDRNKISRDELVAALEALDYKAVWVPDDEFVDESKISLEEIRERRLTKGAKRKLREKIILETAADLFLPMPLQVGYHIYQLITLKDL